MIKDFIKKHLISIFQLLQFSKSYSQDGEDIVLSSFYEGHKHYTGYYVDIGAHHPIRFSNTHLFYKKGWRGINIDPTPGSMRLFNIFRKRDINIEIGVGSDQNEMTFYCFNEPALNTFDEETANSRNTSNSSYKIIKTIPVPIAPLKNILDKHLPKNKKIDFFSIDVEGFDLEVLKTNDWEKYKPQFIMIEDIGFDLLKPNDSKIFNFLTNYGYSIVGILKRTIIYGTQN